MKLEFKLWMEEQVAGTQLSAQQAKQMVMSHKGPLNAEGVRTDMFDNAEHHGFPITYDPDFSISNIGRRIQGYDMGRVMEMIGVMFQTLKLPPPQDRNQIDRAAVAQHAEQFKEMLPPIIVSILPDETYHLGDGNHRLGTARTLGIPTLKAFVIQS